MTAPPKRRWFRFTFSLQTLFIVVTIVGVWLGWQLKIVRERKAVLAEIKRNSLSARCDSVESLDAEDAEFYQIYRVSFVRRLLGDESYMRIYIPPTMGPKWTMRAELAFPESALYLYDWKNGIVEWVP